MPCYHFDSHDGVRFTTDETGVELDGINAARQEAARRLAELAQEILPDDDRRDVVIEVKYDAMEGRRFRHTAHFKRWRTDRDPQSCGYDQLEEPVSYNLTRVLGMDSSGGGS